MHLFYTLRNQYILSPKRKNNRNATERRWYTIEIAVGTHGDVAADGGELLLGLAGDGEAAELGERLLHPLPSPRGGHSLTRLNGTGERRGDAQRRACVDEQWPRAAGLALPPPRRGVGCRSMGDSDDTEPGSMLQRTTR
jgi:hypothetical protein